MHAQHAFRSKFAEGSEFVAVCTLTSGASSEGWAE
jgi:hypothetical protein